jgi:NAD(P)-dependent dehydrogenase (short-subunit alcohol dehydrogenase family)
MKDFRDRVVVITGAGAGIGRATARAFARLGARIHAVDIDLARAEETGQICLRDGATGARSHRADCSDRKDVQALADAIFAAEGRVDVLDNNAGVMHAAPIDDTSLGDWDRVLGLDLFGVIYGIHAFLPRMLEQGGGGAIVNTASGLGLIAAPGTAPYCAAKFGVVGLSESLATELAPRGIYVSVVCPGVISTDLVKNAHVGASVENRRAGFKSFIDRFGASPESVASAVVDAVRKRRVITVVPKAQVLPAWWLKRLSPSTFFRVAGLLNPLLEKR